MKKMINAKFDWIQTIPSKDKQSYVIKNLAISPGTYNFLSFCVAFDFKLKLSIL